MFEELVTPLISNFFIFSLIVFFFCALWGDASLIFFVVFAMNYNLSLTGVFIFAYFGSLLGDSLWFIFGIKLMKKIRRIKKIEIGYMHTVNFIEKVLKNNHFLALVFVKFLYGTRVITTLYLADEKISFKKFMKYNLIATFIWIFFMGVLGYLVGLGFNLILDTFKNIQLAITGLIVFLFIINLIQKFINRKIENESPRN